LRSSRKNAFRSWIAAGARQCRHKAATDWWVDDVREHDSARADRLLQRYERLAAVGEQYVRRCERDQVYCGFALPGGLTQTNAIVEAHVAATRPAPPCSGS
jgi:hypothetical protein